ncbi:MAG: hypothetical protein AAF639_24945 [Chloroflexota bacterium]
MTTHAKLNKDHTSPEQTVQRRIAREPAFVSRVLGDDGDDIDHAAPPVSMPDLSSNNFSNNQRLRHSDGSVGNQQTPTGGKILRSVYEPIAIPTPTISRQATSGQVTSDQVTSDQVTSDQPMPEMTRITASELTNTPSQTMSPTIARHPHQNVPLQKERIYRSMLPGGMGFVYQPFTILRQTSSQPASLQTGGHTYIQRDGTDDTQDYDKREADVIIKFNFAGSGDAMWETHRAENIKTNEDESVEEAQQRKRGRNIYYGKNVPFIYYKEKVTQENLGGGVVQQQVTKHVYEYAGPMSMGGTFDKGKNSTDNNLAHAKGQLSGIMKDLSEKTVTVLIKGFSRGAATATEFANWVNSTYGDSEDLEVNVHVVAIDPVPGPEQNRPTNIDVDGLRGSTWVLPVTSGHNALWAFTPQFVSGTDRVIIIYGPKAGHMFGLNGELIWNGQVIKGMRLGTLPKGLYVAKAEEKTVKQKQMYGTVTENIAIIQPIRTWAQWQQINMTRMKKSESRHTYIEMIAKSMLPEVQNDDAYDENTPLL